MSYPLFTGIFLDDKSIESVQKCFKEISEEPEFPHFYCKHITVFRRPEYPEIAISESEPVVDCFLTSFVQDDHIQLFTVDVPFKSKRFTHLTYAIAGTPPSAEIPLSQHTPEPITSPRYGNHLLDHLHVSSRGFVDRGPEIIESVMENPLRITGRLITVMSVSPRKPKTSVFSRIAIPQNPF